jgi:hypothetical protein
MKVSATSFITILLGETEYKLTKQEAEELYAELGTALGRAGAFTYPAGVRTPYIPLMPQNPWDIGRDKTVD